MSGIFNSTAGRVTAGILSAGASEVGRGAAGIVRRSPLIPTEVKDAQGLLSSSGAGTIGGTASAAATIEQATEERNADAQANQPTIPPLAQPEPYDEEASRRRARESAQRVAGGRRRASEYLTTQALGA